MVESEKKSFFSFIKKKLSFLKWLDPFHYVDLFIMPYVKKITKSESVELIVNVFFAALFAFTFYTILSILFGVTNPLVIVYSASMEPVLYRGDIIGLTKPVSEMDFGPEVILDRSIKNVPIEKYASGNFKDGQFQSILFENGKEVSYQKNSRIVVYIAYPSGIPIIHRSFARIKANDGVFLLTKGDNVLTNTTFDQDCGEIDLINPTSESCLSFYAIPLEEIQGVAFFNIPKLGCVKIWLVDNLISLITTGNLPKDYRGYC